MTCPMTTAPNPRFRLYTRAGDYFRTLLDSLTGQAALGAEIAELEDTVRRYMHIGNALATPQARVAIYFAIKAIIQPGQKVVLSPYTISDVVNMVICAGGVPVFADIERETCNIDPAAIKQAIATDTGAVLVTHLHGLMCDMPEIMAVCQGIPVIEDAAQAFGSKLNGRWAGTWADAGIYSFGMYKNLASFFGGMLISPHAKVYAEAYEELANFPSQDAAVLLKKASKALVTDVVTHPWLFKIFTFWIFRHAFINDIDWLNKKVAIELDNTLKTVFPESFRARMTPLQARIILSKFAETENNTQIRIQYAKTYHDGLKDIPDLIIPPLRTDGSHGYAYFPIQFVRRKELLRHLMAENRDVAQQHLKNCADLPCFSDHKRDCPNARLTAEQNIILPTYPRYGHEEVEKNVRSIQRFFRSN